MSDVEDYMSDTLILNAQYEKKKSRIDGHRERMLAIEKRNQENTLKQTEKLSKHQLETKIRDEGLQKSIEPHNIGFKLLSKLGFQSALSDEKVENTPLITKAPLPIEILTGITGMTLIKT
uniref:G-patch domain-containing protein n=1 Tax=Rhabditophanes sp. KR3021 TaxID=114890 RepID=A0AC35UFE8_9BILA